MANLFTKLFAKKAEQRTVWPISQPYSFQWVGNQVVWKDTTSRNKIADILEQCPVVTTILNTKAQMMNNGQTVLLNSSTGKPIRGEQKELMKLIANPNPIQTEQQFRAQVYAYSQAFGYCPILIIKPVGFIPTELWVLPPQFLEIEEKQSHDPLKSKTSTDWIKKAVFTYGNVQTPIDLNSMYLFQDTTIGVKSYYLPQSRLTSLKYPISNLIAYYQASGELMANRGPRGILSNSNAGDPAKIPMNAKEKERVQALWKQRYGLMPDQTNVVISDAALQWQSMSYNVTELGLNDGYKRDTFDICTGLSFHKDLLQIEGSTFNNVESAEKRQYQDVIIPDSRNYCEQIGEAIGLNGMGITMSMTFDHVEVMQQSEKEKGEGMRAMTDAAKLQFDSYLITYNQFREMVGQEPITGMDLFKYEMPQYDTKETNGQGNQSNQGQEN